METPGLKTEEMKMGNSVVGVPAIQEI